MEHHAGLDVSLEETSICIVDGAGKIIRETQVASEPEALVGYFSALEIKVVCIGLEAGPLSQWLHAALTEAGFEVVLLETRHVKATPLSRLESRLMCPECGSRRVSLLFNVPKVPVAASAKRVTER